MMDLHSDYTYDATIVRWIDGDTVVLLLQLGFHLTSKLDFRLYGIDTPEIHSKVASEKSAATKAKEFSEAWAPVGTNVKVDVFKADKYGRWLARIHRDPAKTSLNEELLTQKLAKPYFGGTKT